MTMEMDKDLKYVFQALPSFGGRYSHLVMGYAQLFGVTPFAVKAKKLRLIIEEMKRLFDAQAFNYQKKTYRISHAGIGEALDMMIKRNWTKPFANHNYLKSVMIDISEREEKDGSRKVDAETRKREDLQRAGLSPSPQPSPSRGEGVGGGADPELHFTREQREGNLTRVRNIIKSIGG